jgi:Glu-tRNA(Gln) amidotransferase subunit E-like FAD-binding protein
MIKNPIPQLQGPPSSFSLEDLGELVEKPQSKFKSPSVPLRESSGSYQQQMTIDPNMLKSMVKEAVAEYFKESYEKRITETTIAKTINLLIKEGKLQTKKKI